MFLIGPFVQRNVAIFGYSFLRRKYSSALNVVIRHSVKDCPSSLHAVVESGFTCFVLFLSEALNANYAQKSRKKKPDSFRCSHAVTLI